MKDLLPLPFDKRLSTAIALTRIRRGTTHQINQTNAPDNCMAG